MSDEDKKFFETLILGLESRFDQKLAAGLAASEARFDTKLAAMEARFDTKLAAMEARFDTKLIALEDRLVEKMREMQSELLRGFESFSVGYTIRLRKIEVDQSNLDASISGRVGVLEGRLHQIEMRLGLL